MESWLLFNEQFTRRFINLKSCFSIEWSEAEIIICTVISLKTSEALHLPILKSPSSHHFSKNLPTYCLKLDSCLQKYAVFSLKYNTMSLTCTQTRISGLNLKLQIKNCVVLTLWIREYKTEKLCNCTLTSFTLSQPPSLQHSPLPPPFHHRAGLGLMPSGDTRTLKPTDC